jgi:uncharacterized membrane protein (GlpM family)
MTSDSLLLHLFLAFVVGSVWVTLVTVVAERSGSALGGLMGGLPSTSAFAFFFIGLNQSPEIAAQATTVFPLSFGFTCSFLFFYALFAKKGFAFGLLSSLVIWFGLSALTVVSGLQDFTLSAIFSSTSYLLNKSKGIDFSRAMARPL